MDGRIGHLHVEFRVPEGIDTSSQAVTRLEQLARGQLADAWEAALTEALGDDPAVYVFRRIETGMMLQVAPDRTDTAIAQHWGERLAGAVVRGVAGVTEDGDSNNLVTFESQAEFVASFVVDLLQGRAFDRWYFGAFGAYKPLGKAGALRAVLLENVSELAAILRGVRERGAFDKLLATLDVATLALLWASLGTRADEQIESLRPLYAAATELIDRLNLWSGNRPDDDALVGSFRLGTVRVDWSDSQSLSRAVAEIIAYFLARGDVRRVAGLELEQITARLDDVLRDLDWLDAGWLRDTLPALLAGSVAITTDLPVRRGGAGPTPKQRELLADITAVLQDERVRLDASDPGSPANRLRLYTALVARASRWEGDTSVAAKIDLLLAVWAGALRAHLPTEVVSRLRRHDLAGALDLLPHDQHTLHQQPFATIADLGGDALEVIDILLAGSSEITADGEWIDTPAAGLFLLLRAIVDARLAGLADQISGPPDDVDRFGALLVALGLRWSGSPADDDVIDAGVSLLAGLDVPPRLSDVAGWWATVKPTSHQQLQTSLVNLLAGQWLARGATLHVHRVPTDGDEALVAGGETAGLWTLGQIMSTDDIGDVLSSWSDIWQQAIGERPSIIVQQDSTDQPNDGEDSLAVGHAADGRALTAALDALAYGRLEIADADLSLFLIANAVLRIWARWLGPFATSSTPYLLEQFIRRPGRLQIDDHSIVVVLEPRPLDVVLEMAGYLAEIEQVPRLGNRRVEFRIGGGE